CVVFVASLIALTIIGLAIWYGRRFFRKKEVALSPRERALAALNGIATEVEKNLPYQFSIRVSDILRRYVMEQFDLPMTRQTSVEFLNAIASAANFSDDDHSLLAWLRGRFGPRAAIVFSATAPFRAIGKSSTSRAGRILRALVWLALAAFMVGIARPQLGKSLTQVEASGIDIMLVLDVSNSML